MIQTNLVNDSSVSEVRDSGVSWIGKIPDDWDVQPLKRVVTCLDNKRVPIDASMRCSGPYPYWGAGNIVDYVDQYLFDEELVLLGEDGAPFFDKTRPVAFLINEKVWVNNHIHVLKAKNIDSEYLSFALNAVDYHEYISGSILPKLTQSDMNSILIPIPPITEQRKIAIELTSKCKVIDSYINYQDRLISKLQDLKQSIITEVVTKGLDNSVSMKDSGVSWIKTIPISWTASKLKFISSERDEVLSEKTDPEFSFPYVEISNVSQEGGIQGVQNIRFKDAPSRARKIVKKNDIIISTVRTYLKAIASIDDDGMVVSTGFLVINPTGINHRFMKYAVLSDYFISSIFKNSYGVSYPAITSRSLMNLEILVPPMDEQIKIADYLDDKISKIDALIGLIEKESNQLNSMRQSLIFEIITGKRAVTKEML